MLLYVIIHYLPSYDLQKIDRYLPDCDDTDQHCLMSNLNPSGQDEGTGRWRLLLPTPQMMADESTSLYGISCVSSSHNTTPNDLREEYGSLRMPCVVISLNNVSGIKTWIVHSFTLVCVRVCLYVCVCVCVCCVSVCLCECVVSE